MMTTARPTWAPAKGGNKQGGTRIFGPSQKYSSRDLAAHTNLKPRTSVMLSLSRALGRRLFSAAAASESAAAASTSAVRKAQNPLEEFFEVERTTEEDKPPPHYGRSWKASELRLKSWDDLQKLWYVLLKEKNMLMSQREMLHSENLRFPNPERVSKVKKSMCRNKTCTDREGHSRT